GRVRERVLQQRHHHQARDQEGGVADAVEDLDTVLQDMPEDQQVQEGRDDRGGKRLEPDLGEAQHLLVEQGQEASHTRDSRMIDTNTSSRSACSSSISSMRQPASRSAASMGSTVS